MVFPKHRKWKMERIQCVVLYVVLSIVDLMMQSDVRMFSLNVYINRGVVDQSGSFTVHRGSNGHGAILQIASSGKLPQASGSSAREVEGGEKTAVKRGSDGLGSEKVG